MKRSLISGVSSVLGATHFVATLVAEKSLEAEASLKHKHLGEPTIDVLKFRVATTYQRIDKLNNMFKSKEQVQCEQVLIEASAS